MTNNKHRKVFISYSWDDIEHQNWVLKLANDLIQGFGVDVILDQYELSPGKDLPHFMESSIEKADKVLIILTPNYKTKAENRSNGVGYETSMISQEVFESPITNIKFIPILRKGSHNESSPKFLTSKISHNMVDDSKYNFQLFSLAKAIHDNSLLKKPALGQIPDFETFENDPIIDIANQLKKKSELNSEINNLLFSEKGYELAENEILKLKDIINQKISLYSSKTDLVFNVQDNNVDSIIIQSYGHSVSFFWNSQYSSSGTNFKLLMKFWIGILRFKTYGTFYLPNEEPYATKIVEYSFDLNSNKEPIWKDEKNIATTEELTQITFSYFINIIQEDKNKKFRNY